MSPHEQLDQLEKLVEPIVNDLGYELVDIEMVTENQRWVLRVYIDNPSGVTLEDCEVVSTNLDYLLDEEDPIPHSYMLEVSSPGAERPLKKPKDFINFAGKKVFVKTYIKIGGRKNFKGKLIGLEDDLVLIETDNEGEVKVPMGKITKAHLLLEI